MTEIEAMVGALSDLMEAKAEYKKCIDSCEYDRGYYCYHESKRVENCEAAFANAFAAAVRAVTQGTSA